MDHSHHHHHAAPPCQAGVGEAPEEYQLKLEHFGAVGWVEEAGLPLEQRLEEVAEADDFPGGFVGNG